MTGVQSTWQNTTIFEPVILTGLYTCMVWIYCFGGTSTFHPLGHVNWLKNN